MFRRLVLFSYWELALVKNKIKGPFGGKRNNRADVPPGKWGRDGPG